MPKKTNKWMPKPSDPKPKEPITDYEIVTGPRDVFEKYVSAQWADVRAAAIMGIDKLKLNVRAAEGEFSLREIVDHRVSIHGRAGILEQRF